MPQASSSRPNVQPRHALVRAPALQRLLAACGLAQSGAVEPVRPAWRCHIIATVPREMDLPGSGPGRLHMAALAARRAVVPPGNRCLDLSPSGASGGASNLIGACPTEVGRGSDPARLRHVGIQAVLPYRPAVAGTPRRPALPAPLALLADPPCAQMPAGSGSLHCAGPDPDVVLVRRRSEPDLNGASGPGDGVGRHEFFDAVLPQDPGVHLARNSRGGDGELAHLLWLQAAGFSLGEARSFGHHLTVSNKGSKERRTFLGGSSQGLDDHQPHLHLHLQPNLHTEHDLEPWANIGTPVPAKVFTSYGRRF